MAENEISLKQHNPQGIELHIKLVNGRELLVASKSKSKSKSKKVKQVYSVDILSLQDKSKKILCIAWKWLFTSVIFFVLMLALLKFLPVYLGENKNMYLAVMIIIGVLGTITCIRQFFKKTSNKQIFSSRNALVPIIILSVNKPNKKTFSSFVESVEKHIGMAQKKHKISEEKQLAGEMKMLRRLSDETIISKKAYKSAKSKLFSGFDSQLILKL